MNHIKQEICPFEKFNHDIPSWFRIYSKYKHDKLILIKRWNLKYALLSLGALHILINNHPDLDYKTFYVSDKIRSKVFDKTGPRPRFASVSIPSNFEDITDGDRVLVYPQGTPETIIDGKAVKTVLGVNAKLQS